VDIKLKLLQRTEDEVRYNLMTRTFTKNLTENKCRMMI